MCLESRSIRACRAEVECAPGRVILHQVVADYCRAEFDRQCLRPEEVRILVVALDVCGNPEVWLILQRDLVCIRPYDVIRDEPSDEFGIENLARGRDGVKFGGRGSKVSPTVRSQDCFDLGLAAKMFRSSDQIVALLALCIWILEGRKRTTSPFALESGRMPTPSSTRQKRPPPRWSALTRRAHPDLRSSCSQTKSTRSHLQILPPAGSTRRRDGNICLHSRSGFHRGKEWAPITSCDHRLSSAA